MGYRCFYGCGFNINYMGVIMDEFDWDWFYGEEEYYNDR